MIRIFLLILLCLVLYVPGIASLPITDRDEPRYAQTSRQLVETSTYFPLKFQNELRHHKPPGIYWLQATSVKIFGEATKIWPYRIPSVLGALCGVLCTYGFARKRLGATVAFWGAALFATTTLLIVEAHLCLTDTVFTCSVILMQCALWRIYVQGTLQQPIHAAWALLFWSAMSFGILVKGISPLFSLLTIIALCFADRSLSWLKGLRSAWGIPLMIFLTLLWIIPLSLSTQHNFLWDMLHIDALPKLMSSAQSHGFFPGIFLLISPLSLWPASLLLISAGFYAWASRHQRDLRFLLAWILPSYLFFECIATKLPQYLLPTYPAITLLIASALIQGKAWSSRALHVFYGLWLVISLCIEGFILISHSFLGSSLSLFDIIHACFVCSACIFAFLLTRQQKQKFIPLILVFISLLFFPVHFHKTLPALSDLWLTERLKNTLRTQNVVLDAQHPLLAVGYHEPSIVFVLGTQNVLLTSTADLIPQLKKGAQWVLIGQHQLTTVAQLLTENQMEMHSVTTLSGNLLNKKRKTKSSSKTFILFRASAHKIEVVAPKRGPDYLDFMGNGFTAHQPVC